ncbi:MAG TPA: glycerol acyltransferase [Flavobacteriaceae bacterium]|jgi:putative hemolysin|nr:glycerol acyltransferase [Flavobacteriaceae bacterium]
MSLVSAKEMAQASGLSRWGLLGELAGWVLIKITRISALNRFYDAHKHLDGPAFMQAVMDYFEIDVRWPEQELKRFPKTGPFVVVSNHPLGGIDGILLLLLVGSQRPDFKVMANFLLSRITPLAPYIFPVNPFEDHKEASSSLQGFKQALAHLAEGGVLGIFPAGEVATTRAGNKSIDQPWHIPALKLIRKAGVPVVPVYFHAKNSTFFYRIARLGPAFRTAALVSEMFTQRFRKISIRIGKPISVSQQEEELTIEEYGALLRLKTEMLSKVYERRRLTLPSTIQLPKIPKKIVGAQDPELLAREIAVLQQLGKSLLKSKNYEVFLAQAPQIPGLLQEIGRQRELTFRAIGEGTNKSIDLDTYDTYYHHLFLWDHEGACIVGAYRMGFGQEIFSAKGIEGFYVQDLFRMEPELYPMMQRTIEMGRAYIVSEYQQKPMPLFLLWKGIIHTTLRYPDHDFLMGGVSISNQFSNFSKSLMIEFMKSHYWDPYIAQYIHPKKEFKVKLKDADKEFVFDETQADLNKFDRLIEEVEPGSLRLPVLIKKYIKQNAKVVAFNVDPLFNNAIDGLMYIKISEIPEETVRPVMEEFQKEIERGNTQ